MAQSNKQIICQKYVINKVLIHNKKDLDITITKNSTINNKHHNLFNEILYRKILRVTLRNTLIHQNRFTDMEINEFAFLQLLMKFEEEIIEGNNNVQFDKFISSERNCEEIKNYINQIIEEIINLKK